MKWHIQEGPNFAEQINRFLGTPAPDAKVRNFLRLQVAREHSAGGSRITGVVWGVICLEETADGPKLTVVAETEVPEELWSLVADGQLAQQIARELDEAIAQAIAFCPLIEAGGYVMGPAPGPDCPEPLVVDRIPLAE